LPEVGKGPAKPKDDYTVHTQKHKSLEEKLFFLAFALLRYVPITCFDFILQVFMSSCL
jgi:hypothetical protein